jgi:hypothetical protein
MRDWLNYVAWFCFALIIGIEVSALAFLPVAATADLPTPGLGITTLGLIDGLIFYSWTTIKLGGLVPEKILTPTTKISNFIFFLVMLIVSITVFFITIALLLLMISLLMAIPFGTVAYMAMYADFPKGAAQATLGMLLFLKMAFAVIIVFGEKRLFEDYRKFLILLGCSFLLNIALSFLHAFVPGFLVSITDAIGAIIISIFAIIWFLILFIGSIWGVITLIMDAVGSVSRGTDKLRT